MQGSKHFHNYLGRFIKIVNVFLGHGKTEQIWSLTKISLSCYMEWMWDVMSVCVMWKRFRFRGKVACFFELLIWLKQSAHEFKVPLAMFEAKYQGLHVIEFSFRCVIFFLLAWPFFPQHLSFFIFTNYEMKNKYK